MMVYDKEGNVIPAASAAPEDKVYIGNGTPKHYVSWSNTFRYKNFDLNLFFHGAFGYEIFNMRKYGMGLQGCGTDNVLRSAYLDDKDLITGGGVISSYFLEKGDYFKLENVTLGYNFTPKNTDILNSMRVYISAKNLFTLTKYSGNDPSIVGTNGLTPSVDVIQQQCKSLLAAISLIFIHHPVEQFRLCRRVMHVGLDKPDSVSHPRYPFHHDVGDMPHVCLQ